MHGVSDLIARYVNQAAKKIGLSLKVDKSDVFNTADYVGQGYGVVTPDVVEMIKLMARTEGIFLDPVYTGKAMAGLRDHIRKGILTKNDTVIFLHTGGTPALFAYVDDLGLDELVSHVDLQ